MGIDSSRLVVCKFMERYFSKFAMGPEAHLIVNWALIVGTHLSEISSPVKINFAPDGVNTLVLNVRNGCDAVSIRYAFTEILDRIAQFYGYRLVKKLIIKQKIEY